MTPALDDDRLLRLSGGVLGPENIEKLAVAASGGGDSMACLDLMVAHGRTRGFAVEAVSLNHGLRREAADEIALVSAYCEPRGVPHSVLDWSWDGEGNLQARARAARYGLIGDWARVRGVSHLALGHTRDDVAEGFLMRVARQSGVEGLARMEPRFERAGVTWLRPLLDVGRGELRDHLRDMRIPWSDDPSNADPAFERVRARQALAALPLDLDAEALARVATSLASARDALAHYTYVEAGHHVVEEAGDIILRAQADMPGEIRFRLLRAALHWIGGEPYPPRRSSMAAMAEALETGTTHTLAGCRISTEAGRDGWRITRERAAVEGVTAAVGALWDGRWVVAGPSDRPLEVRVLGAAIQDTPWRAAALPRASLEASPAVWDGDALVAAPLAGFGRDWTAKATGRGNFLDFLRSS